MFKLKRDFIFLVLGNKTKFKEITNPFEFLNSVRTNTHLMTLF